MKLSNIGFKDIRPREVFKHGYEALVISNEGGFAPFQAFHELHHLHILREAYYNPSVTLVKIDWPKLGRIIVCSAERSIAYSQFARPDFGKPYKDFYYNVSYESFQLCYQSWGATKIAMTHLCGGGGRRFNENPTIAACTIEAWLHLHQDKGQLDFVGCCIEEETIEKAKKLILTDPNPGQHRPIWVEKIDEEIFENGATAEAFVIDWRRPSHHQRKVA